MSTVGAATLSNLSGYLTRIFGGTPGQPLNVRTVLYDTFLSPTITPRQVNRNLGIGSGIGLGLGLITNGFGSLFSFEGLLNIAGLASLIPGMQWLMIPVAAIQLARAATNIFGALGSLWEAGKSLLSLDFGGFISNLGGALLNAGAAALTVACALPIGRLLKLGPAFKACMNGNIPVGRFIGGSLTHLYGHQAASPLINMFGRLKGAGAAGTAGGFGRTVMSYLEQGRNGVYTFFRPSYVAPPLRWVA